MFNTLRIKLAQKLLSKSEFLLVTATPTGEGAFECASILTKKNEALGEAFYETIRNNQGINTFVLDVAKKYLSRYEVAQKEFIESIQNN